MSMMTGGQALVEGLRAHGVEVVFGIPGTHNLEIYKYLATSGIRHVGVRHEQGAGYAADGYARVSGRPGVAVVTTGPAALNAATALGQAYSDSVPILVISPGMPLRHPATGNGLLHEMKNQSAAMETVAAASLRVTSVEEIPGAVASAFAIMTTARPRPVHLEVPLDVLEEAAEITTVPAPLARPRHLPAHDTVEKAVALLGSCERALMVVGGGAREAADQVRSTAELLGALVVTTTNGKGVLAEDHPLSLGAGTHLPAVRELAEQADVVLAVGTELAPADLWYGPLPVVGKLVRIDVDPVGTLANAVPEVALVGDATETLELLAARLEARPTGWDVAAWQARRREEGRAEGAVYLPIVEAMGKALPRDAVVSADNAMACYYGARTNLPVHVPGGYLFPSGYGTLGYGLPAAIGAKVALPDRAVVAMLGDGGVMFTLPELAGAAEAGLALPVVVVDNGGYGEIRNEMRDRDDPIHAVTFPSPDLAAAAVAMGCHGIRLEDPAEITEALLRALGADRPTLIHVVLPEGVDQ